VEGAIVLGLPTMGPPCGAVEIDFVEKLKTVETWGKAEKEFPCHSRLHFQVRYMRDRPMG
jgi:hypothetical protein